MLISYFDEVKQDPTKQPFYWLAAITIPATIVRDLELQVAVLSKECFGRAELSRETEFHATDIYNRTKLFKAWSSIDKRLAVLKRLLKIVDRPGEIFKTYVRIDPSRMVKQEGVESWAFMFLVEKLNDLLSAEKQIGLLIGDYESESVTNLAAVQLSTYRADATPYFFGREITQLVDTVHFTRSHLSRMLQLADAYAWVTQFARNGNHREYPGSDLMGFLREDTQLLSPSKYKEWPTANSWYAK